MTRAPSAPTTMMPTTSELGNPNEGVSDVSSSTATEVGTLTADLPRERIAVLLDEVRAGVVAMSRGEAQQAYAGDERLERAYAAADAAVKEYDRVRRAHFRRARAMLAVLELLIGAAEADLQYRMQDNVQQRAVPIDVWSELLYLLGEDVDMRV